ncbi:di-trans,poly-cis-decaprenylcistransferase [Patescibacteria group bacterium]|nr:di-trans,poly-cis-decaprenylcistransferase [Patescibacteria group bacterium]MBP9710458.1 di-trans,poly-cis-decaprenylcistransferase [Patescibacteria group bacterium]
MATPPLRHLALIMDGNRRYARERGLPTLEGHRAGYKTVKQLGDWCLARGLEIVTIWAFSSENWKRAEEEVGYLMDLLEWSLRNDVDEFHQKGIRLKVIGQRERLRPSIIEGINNAEERTKNNTRMTLVIALNYGGRAEIVDAVKHLIQSGVPAQEVDEAKVTSVMYWPDMPEPDLIIRTSGEERLSGFLLWQAPYAELFWCKKNWPDFSEQDLDTALEDYTNRQRRYGK